METKQEDKYKLPKDPVTFLARVIEAFPEDYITLRKVIGIGNIKYSDHPSMTAAVANTKPYTLIFGRPFLQEQMKTIEDCVFLLSHELTHLILDHFAKDIIELFEEKSLGEQATHIIVDCQVNATCYHSLREEKYLEFLKRYYSETKMPHCFLRPDGKPPTPELQELHDKLYSIDGITNEDLIEGLLPWFEQNQDDLKNAIKDLLGNHSDLTGEPDDSEGAGSMSDLTSSYGKDVQKALEDAVKELEEEGKLPKPKSDDKKEQGKGAGNDTLTEKQAEKEAQGAEGKVDTNKQTGRQPGSGEQLTKCRVDIVLEKIKHSRKIRENLKRIYVSSPSSRINKALDGFVPKVHSRTPIPNFYDRRTVALYSTGRMPVFHNHKNMGNKIRVPWYIDVSGSQSHVIKYVINVASKNRRLIGNSIYCFSTKLVETSIDKFARGEYHSTGGTAFNPVAEHILANNFRNALILTDGQAGLSDSYIERLRQKGVNIKVGWTVQRPDFEPLTTVAKEHFFVFDKNSGIGEGYGW